MNLHQKTWEIVEVAKPGDTPSRLFDITILFLIFLNVIAVIIGSVQSVQERCGAFLSVFETVSVAVFTVGYGDMYPVTILGKFFASVIAILGIGMFALPTGILGAGFVEAIQKRKGKEVCPHCGKDIR